MSSPAISLRQRPATRPAELMICALPQGNLGTNKSDQSHVVLALRCFAWYRNPIRRIPGGGANEVAFNGDYNLIAPWLVGGAAIGNAPASVQDYYRLIWQTEEQLQGGAFAA